MQEIDAIVELTLTRSAMDMEAQKLFSWVKSAAASNVYKNDTQHGADKAVDGDDSTRWATDEKTSSATLTIQFSKKRLVSKVHIQEVYQRVEQWKLDLMVDGKWQTLTEGTTLGAKFERAFPSQKASAARLRITKASDGPSLAEINFSQ